MQVETSGICLPLREEWEVDNKPQAICKDEVPVAAYFLWTVRAKACRIKCILGKHQWNQQQLHLVSKCCIKWEIKLSGKVKKEKDTSVYLPETGTVCIRVRQSFKLIKTFSSAAAASYHQAESCSWKRKRHTTEKELSCYIKV